MALIVNRKLNVSSGTMDTNPNTMEKRISESEKEFPHRNGGKNDKLSFTK